MKTIDVPRTVQVIRYIAPLREGGSLPALAEADDGFKYVLKFRGAGHGVKALIAELIGCAFAKTLGFKVPETVFAVLDEAFGRTEGDEEIQDLLRASRGLNFGLHYLSGAVTFDPAVNDIDADTASEIVWLDSFLTNVDRTFRNTNLLVWNREIWLIDHGASLFFHHAWDGWEKHSKSAFPLIKDHVLLPYATAIDKADETLRARIGDSTIEEIVGLIPDDWLDWPGEDLSPDDIRDTYIRFFRNRLANAATFVTGIKDARQALV